MEKEKIMYEIGYLLTPQITEDKVDDEISSLRKYIEDCDGMVMGEGRIKSQKLSYTLNKKGVGKFNSAYFNWIRFILKPEKLVKVKNLFEKNQKVIRFLVTKTEEETIKKDSKKTKAKSESSNKNTIMDEAKNKEIDEKIEELIK